MLICAAFSLPPHHGSAAPRPRGGENNVEPCLRSIRRDDALVDDGPCQSVGGGGVRMERRKREPSQPLVMQPPKI